MAHGPEGGAAFWVHADDGVRLRVGHWRRAGGARGTVLLFPGRTEYIEKYGDAAKVLGAAGYDTLCIDWRGQGLSDRLASGTPLSGHVAHFTDYQRDVAAMQDAARALDLPRPWLLLAHSMGGAIGLRALHDGLDVAAAAFSSPFWGLNLPRHMRMVAHSLARLTRDTRFESRFPPGVARSVYTRDGDFEQNLLTGDAEMYGRLVTQVTAHPELALAGPSLRWVGEALHDTATLQALPSPDLRAIAILGSREQIVDPEAIRERMARWPRGRLIEIEGARHEGLIETPERRARIYAEIRTLFDAACAPLAAEH
ncbi:alpha/beta hydrolase [Profundibacterium mesophilum]|uniref:Esteraselipasethioesterase n=1 Tax=Profundibacterium mesophilum KAUST100406-0324 TaxID=1037889 RepID=A0A921NT23_9RHOB|nr:alpha/beta hydrolase [Profundibacterium mesophilum]KAF0674958.1 putative Esteraselipasethioesterase [Profundibacterium mesophilum KAUST100406-0324]